MRLNCYGCGKSVSTEVPDSTIVRASLDCPECIEKKPDLEARLRAVEGERDAARALLQTTMTQLHVAQQEEVLARDVIEAARKFTRSPSVIALHDFDQLNDALDAHDQRGANAK